MATTDYKSDLTGSNESAAGSDRRANVSSRADSREYYNSRDESQAFSLVWDDASSEAGQMVAYWKNDDATGKQLVISSVGLNSELASSFKLHVVTGTAAGGTATTPACLNRAIKKIAAATARTADVTPITGLAIDVTIDHASVGVDGHEELRLDNRVRLGQGDAIAIEFEQGATSRTWGVIFGFYEAVKK